MNAVQRACSLLSIFLAAAAATPAAAAQADPAASFPQRPVRFLIPFVPGAGTDTTARTIAQKLSEMWGQQFIADNRTGAGGLQHFAGEMFNHHSGARLTHVPYKGTSAVIVAMLAGEVQVGFGTLFGVRPHMESGRLRVLAITAGKRSAAIPDIPTVAESGVPGYEVDQWYGVITSAKVPRAIVQKLNHGIAELLKGPEVVKRLASDGSTPVGSSPDAFNAHIKAVIAKWRKLVRDAGLKLQG